MTMTMTLRKKRFAAAAKALVLVCAVPAFSLLASAQSSPVTSDSPLPPDVVEDVVDRCGVEMPTTPEEADIRQARNEWALQCGYITSSVYQFLYKNFWVWQFVSFAKIDKANGYPIWRPEDFDQLKRDANGVFVSCGKPADVRLFTLCKAPNDG